VTLTSRWLDRLKGRTAWITGGKRIGRTVACALAEHGVNLVLTYRRSAAEAVETAEAARRSGVRAIALRADVSSPEDFGRAVEQARQEFPVIDILVNMASVYRRVDLESIAASDWEDNINTHVLGTFWPVRLIAPLMPPGGHIINVADIASVARPQKRNLPYLVTKAAVAGMTRVMALEYGERGLFVNAIAPGAILRPEGYPREDWDRLRETSPVQFPVTDEEAVEQFALLALYLSVTTMSSGHIYPLDQGRNLR
jgi:3-oxoacyl-[acyl-carrier protein] reductase